MFGLRSAIELHKSIGKKLGVTGVASGAVSASGGVGIYSF